MKPKKISAVLSVFLMAFVVKKIIQNSTENLQTLKTHFEDINLGRKPTAMLPSRMEVVIPEANLGDGDLLLTFIDTRGLDGPGEPHGRPREMDRKKERPEKADQSPVDSRIASDIPEMSLRSLASCIDIDEGLRRCKGNNALFFKLIRDFALDNAGMIAKIGEAVESRNIEEARGLAHTLKGLAGNLSAMKLHEAAVKLEAAMKKEFPNEREINERLKIAGESFAAIAESVRAIEKTAKSKHALSENSLAEREIDPAEIKPVLTELHGLLAVHRTEPNPKTCWKP